MMMIRREKNPSTHVGKATHARVYTCEQVGRWRSLACVCVDSTNDRIVNASNNISYLLINHHNPLLPPDSSIVLWIARDT